VKERYTRDLGCTSYVKGDLNGVGALDTFQVLARFNKNRRPIRWFVTAVVDLERNILKPLNVADGYYPRLVNVQDEDGDGRLEVILRFAPPRNADDDNSGLAAFRWVEGAGIERFDNDAR
jgi:hypothetical protein